MQMKKASRLLHLLLTAAAMLSACTPEPAPKPTPKPIIPGYTVLEDWVTENDFDYTALPGDEETDVLVIPVNIPKENRKNSWTWSIEWTDDNNYFLNELEDVYNNENSTKQYAVKPYFDRASSGKKTFNNYIAPVFNATNYKEADLQSSMQTLMNMIREATEVVERNYGANQFRKRFDKDGDGFVDALNIVLNIWGEVNTNLWPHSYTISSTVQGHTTPGRYTITNIPKCLQDNYSVITHELSHMFGLDDYYDYEYSGGTFTGGFDMQDENAGDWNAFSKFSVGWGKPYVVNGENDEVTITIGSSQVTNEYIVIPADYDEFQDSPFGEYFMIELINSKGNNATDMNNYFSGYSPFGAKMLHVNGTMTAVQSPITTYVSKPFAVLKTMEDAINFAESSQSKRLQCQHACNNTVPGTARPVSKGYENFPILSVVEACKLNGLIKGHRHINASDLFYTDDEFTFDDYSNFITKDCKPQESMNDGSYFPWSIHFDEVSEDTLTVTITRV